MERRDALKEVTNTITGSNIEPQGTVDDDPSNSKPSEAVAQPPENKENGFSSKSEIDVSECPASTEEQKILNSTKGEDDVCELFSKLQIQTVRKSQEELEENSNPQLDAENKEIEKEEPVGTPPNLQSAEVQATSKLEEKPSEVFSTEEYKSPTIQDAEFLNKSHSPVSVHDKLEDTPTEKQEHVKDQIVEETCESPEKVLQSESGIKIKSISFFQKVSEPESETEPEKLVENLEVDFKTEPSPEKSNRHLESDDKVEKLDSDCGVKFQYDQSGEVEEKQSEQSGHEFEKEKSEGHVDSSCEVKLHPPIHSESNCEVDFESKNLSLEIEESKTEGEIESCEVDVPNIREEITEFCEAISPIVNEVVPDNKTEESGEIIPQPQETTDENTKVDTDSDITYTHQDYEHHLDSGVDSIEESYTKSPKSRVDFEDSGRGEKQDSTSDQEVSDFPETKLDHTHDKPIRKSFNLITFDDSIIDDTVQNETPQLVGESEKPRIEEETKLVKEQNTQEQDETIVNLIDNQKPDTSASVDINSLKAKMADLSEQLSGQQQENSHLKLQLNAIQQAKASLQLEIRQKEEIIIKTQAEALKNEQTFKQEIKQLREKLKENSKLIETDISKELEDQLKEAKAREAKVVAEFNQKSKDILDYEKILEEYENTIATRYADYKKLKEEHETAIRHLANIELAFSDVHQKYEKTKALVLGFKSNEDTLKMALQDSEETFKRQEERYESLKAHAKGQIEKSNKEILTSRDKYEMDVNKLKAIIKRLEIKCSSLQVSLQQKTEECAALSALCDEVTGKKV